MKNEIRYLLYDLLFSMFVREPPDEVIEAWREGLGAAAEALPATPIAAGAEQLRAFLDGDEADEAVRGECMELFWRVQGGPKVSLLASVHDEGKAFGKYLIRLRTFIEKTPFRKIDDYTEPEDSLPFHLDLMRSMIREESETECPQTKAEWLALQGELVNDCMRDWVPAFTTALAKREGQPFYARAAGLLSAFFEVECDYLLEVAGNARAAAPASEA